MSGVSPPWRDSNSTNEDEFDDGREAAEAAEQGMIVTEGAARAIEHGERVESLRLILKQDGLTLEAPDHVWFHLLGALDREAVQGCAPCHELAEVLARVLSSL